MKDLRQQINDNDLYTDVIYIYTHDIMKYECY